MPFCQRSFPPNGLIVIGCWCVPRPVLGPPPGPLTVRDPDQHSSTNDFLSMTLAELASAGHHRQMPSASDYFLRVCGVLMSSLHLNLYVQLACGEWLACFYACRVTAGQCLLWDDLSTKQPQPFGPSLSEDYALCSQMTFFISVYLCFVCMFGSALWLLYMPRCLTYEMSRHSYFVYKCHRPASLP